MDISKTRLRIYACREEGEGGFAVACAVLLSCLPAGWDNRSMWTEGGNIKLCMAGGRLRKKQLIGSSQAYGKYVQLV